MILSSLAAAIAFQPLTIRAVGDVMLARGVERRGVNPFKTLRSELRGAGILFGNLECALTTKRIARNKPYLLKANPKRADWLADAGFDVLSLNNNHTGDCGSEGFFETAFTIESRNITPLTEDPVVISKNGVKVGFVAYTDFGREACPGMAIFTMARLKQDLIKMNAPIRVVSIHWGVEGSTVPSPRQKELARLMAAQGVDLVLGHGTHVLQPVEKVGGCLVAYSLGDFVFDINKPPRNQGAMLDVLIEGPGISAHRLVPVISGYQPKLDLTRKLPHGKPSSNSMRELDPSSRVRHDR